MVTIRKRRNKLFLHMHIPLREGDGDAFPVKFFLDLADGIEINRPVVSFLDRGPYGNVDRRISQFANNNLRLWIFQHTLVFLQDIVDGADGFSDVIRVADAYLQVEQFSRWVAGIVIDGIPPYLGVRD